MVVSLIGFAGSGIELCLGGSSALTTVVVPGIGEGIVLTCGGGGDSPLIWAVGRTVFLGCATGL